MTTRKKHITIVIVIGISICISLVVPLVIWRKHITIAYHKQRVRALVNREPKHDPASGFSYFGEDWRKALEKHRDRLGELGYLERKEFRLATIKTPSLKFRSLWEELRGRFPDNPYTIGLGYESDIPATIVVYDDPGKLVEWERIISAHDALPTNIVSMKREKDMKNLQPFIGRWGDKEGDVSYIILRDATGTVRVEIAQNERWRSILKSVRFENKMIMFDNFNYVDPSEENKSINDDADEHPFSGVRYETTLELNAEDPNQLFESTSCYYFADPNRDVLHRLE